MKTIHILFSLLGSLAFAEMDLPKIKGILLVDNASKVREKSLNEIEGVQFDGLVENQELAKELHPFLENLPLTSHDAQDLCKVVASYYTAHNDVRFAAKLAEQDVTDGVVQLVVEPERVGEVKIKENRYTESDALKKWVRLSTSDAVNQRTLAEDVGWLNTNPFRTVKTETRSSGSGVTDVDLIVSDKKDWKMTTGVDNTGTAPIGIPRIFAGFNVNNFIFTDHTFKFQATTTNHYRDYQKLGAEYMALLPWRNTLKIAGSYSSTNPSGAFPRKYKESFEASARYAIPQWFIANPWVNQITYEAGFDFKGMNTNQFDESMASPVKRELAYIGQFTANVTALRNQGGNKWTAAIDLVGSPARMLPHQEEADFDNLRKGATPIYFYTRYLVSMEQKVLGNWTLFSQGRGQFSFSHLIPSEQFSLGGYNTVRGYYERIVGGDHSVCGNFEIRSPEFAIAGVWYPKFADKIQFLGFLDAGYGWFRTNPADAPSGQGLFSIGPGVRYAVSSYFSSRLDVGFPLLKVEKEHPRPYAHFSALMNY